jgi:hypothetical protein
MSASAAAAQGGAAMSAAGGLPVLTQAYLAAHVVGTSGSDVIWGPLYDSLAYPSAGSTAFTFFNQGVGAGTTSSPGAGNGAKTLYDTNIITPNMLTMGNEFYAIGSETHILPGVQNTVNTPYAFLPSTLDGTTAASFINDVWAIGNGGLKVLTVGTDRKYINDGPLAQFPPAKWLQVAAALASIGPTTTAYLSAIDYAAWGGEPYAIVPIYLQSNQNFTLQIGFAAAIPTPSQTIGRLIERLRGYLIRSVT